MSPHPRQRRDRFSRAGKHTLRAAGAFGLGLLIAAGVSRAARDTRFMPLPEDALPASNPLLDLANHAMALTGRQLSSPKLPEWMVVRNTGGQVYYDSEKRTISYSSNGKEPVFLRTDLGQEIYAHSLTADLENKQATLNGPVVIYQGETLTRAEGGSYSWDTGHATVYNVRAKVNGLLVRGSQVDYGKDEQNRSFVTIQDAYVSPEDIEEPAMWVGTGKLTVYPGDSGTISRLSLSSHDIDMPVPVLGWVPISHSLNPREGYLPMPGMKSIWGAYLCNSYGILLGNRRVENGMPVADYVATAKVDYRVRRGLALGLDFSDEDMRHRYDDMKGLSLYYAADKHPNINPTRTKRLPVRHNRYRAALQARWSFDSLNSLEQLNMAKWSLTTDINLLGDRYMLRDFFEDIGRLNDKPDNTVRVERLTPMSHTMLLGRFAPNNFYSTDERAELSYYRVRSMLGKSGIAYETRNSAGLMHQTLPLDERIKYETTLKRVTDPDLRDYYLRLLNTHRYARINSTHELSTGFKIMKFLNVTPKVGAGYTGYYGVDEVGTDNRVLGYIACDFDIKFSRHYSNVFLPSLGIDGLYHVFHPYATISHGTISSSNRIVPQIDTWSSTLGSSTLNPMPLDLMSYTGIDSWAKWTVWRIGASNVISTIYDGESRTLLSWDVFIDYNITNPNTENNFSNLYSFVTFTPTRRLRIRLETQTPTVCGGDGFNQYNTSVTMTATQWLELQLGHRYISGHPIQRDANLLHTGVNLRFSENYSGAARVYWDAENKRLPIQQYSLFRKFGAWYVGSTVFLRDNGGKKETGIGLSFTLGETATSLPVNLY